MSTENLIDDSIELLGDFAILLRIMALKPVKLAAIRIIVCCLVCRVNRMLYDSQTAFWPKISSCEQNPRFAFSFFALFGAGTQ